MSYFTEQRLLDTTPVTTVLNQIHTMMGAHAAWSHVEDSTDGSYTVRTYFCDGAVNGLMDFYLHLSYVTSNKETNNVYIQVSEDWDAGAKKLIRGAVNPGTTFTPEGTYNSATGATSYVPSSTNWNRNVLFATSQTDFTYWIVLTERGFWIRTSVSTYPAYGGLFEPFWSHANEYPLYLAPIGYTDTDGSASFSRRPSETSSLTDAFAGYAYNSSGYSIMIGTVPDTGTLYDKSYGSRFVALHTTAGSGGIYRGLLYDMLLFNVDSAVDIGDTIDIGADTYVCLYDTGSVGYFVNTEAP